MTRFSSFLFLALPLLVGFSFTPMSQTIELSQGQKEAQFILDNPTDAPMPLIVSVTTRQQNPTGPETLDKTSELTVFPPQLILPAKEKRTVRVQWKGEIGTVEKAFRVIAEQMPVDVDKTKGKKTGIKMLLRYMAALYVNPGKTEAKLVVEKVEMAPSLRVTIKNEGSKHQLMMSPTLTLSKGSEKVKLTGDELQGLAGENVLAGSTRTFVLAYKARDLSAFTGALKLD